ncbi:MAG: hypothetical protein K2X90_01080 [Candidatus Babeliaceae bacterium]|nr:hypothetical protein [Candidatus Babeliaceae bacterium]
MKKCVILFLFFLNLLIVDISSQPVYSEDQEFNKFLKELSYYQSQILQKKGPDRAFTDLLQVRISNSLKKLRLYASVCGVSNTYKALCNDGTECETSVFTEAGSLAYHWNEPALFISILNRYGSLVASLDLHIKNL